MADTLLTLSPTRSDSDNILLAKLLRTFIAISNGDIVWPSGGSASFPTQTGHSGEFLTTNGTDVAWAVPAGGGNALTSNPLSQFAATTSAQLAGVISDENGSGKLLFAAGTLNITAGKTATFSNTLTLAGTDGSSVAFGAGGTVLYDNTGATLSGTNAFTGANTFAGVYFPLFTAMAALAVDVTKAGNSKSITGDVTFTYSNATPADGTATVVRITADGTNRTVTIPSTWSLARGGNITSLLVPASTVLQVRLQYLSSRWEIIGDPVQTNGTGNYLLSAGTAAIASGKTLTVSNSLTLAGTDGTTMTFPTTSATLARTDAANTFTGIQTITNLTLPTNGQILLTIPSTDGHATGPTTNAFNSGYSSSAVGDLVYLDSSATWQKCDANTLALYNGLLGIALEVKASGAALLVALPGSFVYATGFPTLTIGGPVYMSETAGAITQTAPTTTDAATRVIGWGVHADKLYFFPSPDYTTHV